jgi:transposase
MARYKYLDHLSQGLILTLNLKDQLSPGTFEFTLNHLIDQADLSVFDAAYHNDEKGAPAYSPSVLLKIYVKRLDKYYEYCKMPRYGEKTLIERRNVQWKNY